MGATYEAADDGVMNLIYKVQKTLHKPHADAGVTIQAVMAHPPVDENGDATGPAIKVRGHAVGARIRVTTLKQRAMGDKDLEIEIDDDGWDVLSYEETVALIDHELRHVDLKTKEGVLVRDDLGRPMFTKRYHDVEFGWFFDNARQHGAVSPEVRQLARFLTSEHYTQCFLPGMEPVEA